MNRYEYNKVSKMLDELQLQINNIRALIEVYEEIDVNSGDEQGKDAAVGFLKKILSDGDVQLPKEYSYSCLPLCLIDAIYSIGVRYTSTKKVVEHYCEHYKIEPFCDKVEMDKFDKLHTLSNLIAEIEEYRNDFEWFAKEILKNEQRTSSRNGVLKIVAVYECAKVLKYKGIDTVQDFNEIMNNDKVANEIKKEFCAVKGQTSGISLDYLKMLCGRTNVIKPDRHILRFLSRFSKEEVSVNNAPAMMEEIWKELIKDYPKIDLRTLDYIIWEYMKNGVSDFNTTC